MNYFSKACITILSLVLHNVSFAKYAIFVPWLSPLIMSGVDASGCCPSSIVGLEDVMVNAGWPKPWGAKTTCTSGVVVAMMAIG